MSVYLRVALRYTVRQPALIRLVERILSLIGEDQSELSVNLVGDARIRRLNHDYRKKDRATDVLAFPIREAMMPRGIRGPTGLLGDVVISIPTAVRQAQETGRSVNEELAALLVHGVLHLCGYDHERSAQEAARMVRRERMILRRLAPVPRLVSPRTGRRKKRN
jgi:rRNA maturation RNase YbeY